ncbi:MAG: hypothetical protein M5U26_03645 [Planctomycetota bacterium]|nr:hypothetical protein [Planctomycetota bacterium]
MRALNLVLLLLAMSGIVLLLPKAQPPEALPEPAADPRLDKKVSPNPAVLSEPASPAAAPPAEVPSPDLAALQQALAAASRNGGGNAILSSATPHAQALDNLSDHDRIALREIHNIHSKNFIGAKGFGVERMRYLPEVGMYQLRRGRARVELVSLLEHEEPVVYEKDLTKMPDLSMGAMPKETRTRTLTVFERDALAQLRRGRDEVYHRDRDTDYMVGSLRASAGCLKCHSVKQGDLLGALTYRISQSPKP